MQAIIICLCLLTTILFQRVSHSGVGGSGTLVVLDAQLRNIKTKPEVVNVTFSKDEIKKFESLCTKTRQGDDDLRKYLSSSWLGSLFGSNDPKTIDTTIARYKKWQEKHNYVCPIGPDKDTLEMFLTRRAREESKLGYGVSDKVEEWLKGNSIPGKEIRDEYYALLYKYESLNPALAPKIDDFLLKKGLYENEYKTWKKENQSK